MKDMYGNQMSNEFFGINPVKKKTNIQKLIKEVDLGRLGFAALTGKSESTVNCWYYGTAEPSQVDFELIRDACKWRMNSES